MTSFTLHKKHILLGVTGGIAAYKSAEICRHLVKAGACVHVVMSEAATAFIAPLTLETLSGNPVSITMFNRGDRPLSHIQLAAEADTMVVAPATADYLARCAAGRACDLISSVTLAFPGTVFVAPAMNTHMWHNPATRRNVRTLVEEHGFVVIPPVAGELACGVHGDGKMADPVDIVARIAGDRGGDLQGKTIVVSAGPTVEDLDPVRFISNRSSGKTGYAIAAQAARRGAQVILISGPTALSPPAGVTVYGVRSAQEMATALTAHCRHESPPPDALIMCAAVSDFRPVRTCGHKIKKPEDDRRVTIQLEKNIDILASLGDALSGTGTRVVGFALESENLLEHAADKLNRKKCHMMVANRPGVLDADETDVTLVFRDGTTESVPTGSKRAVADILLTRIFELTP